MTARQLLRFSTAAGEYAVDVGAALEIIPAGRLVRLPTPADGVAGVVEREGTTLPVTTILGPGPDPAHIVVVGVGAAVFGFLVDRVHRIDRPQSGTVGPAPPGQAAALIGASYPDGDALVLVVDVGRVVDAVPGAGQR